MDLIQILRRFPDDAACMRHLEDVRWGDDPRCPYCGGVSVARKVEGERVRRWNCHECKASFNVLAKTIFSGTRTDLSKWFAAIALVLNAKKSLSSPQLGRDLGIPQRTAYRMLMKIRGAMAADTELLSGIVEADEVYVGGKPRKHNKRDDDEDAPPGRGTRKLPVIGVVERGGKVRAQPSPRVTQANLTEFIGRTVNQDDAVLITDQFVGYNRVGRTMPHMKVDHSQRYVDGWKHVNTMESFWALLKRAWWGAHHHYSRTHAHAYVTEACYKYNIRKMPNAFQVFIQDTMMAAV